MVYQLSPLQKGRMGEQALFKENEFTCQVSDTGLTPVFFFLCILILFHLFGNPAGNDDAQLIQ